MRRIFVSMILVAALVWAATTSGCGGDSGDASDGSLDSFGIIQGGDGTGGEGGEGDGGAGETTSMRLAHASPDLGAIDFCWRPSGAATFSGPVLGGGHALEAGPPGNGGGDASSTTDGGDAGGALEGGDENVDEDDGGYGDASEERGDSGETGPVDAGPPGPVEPGTLVFGEMTPTVVLPTAGTFDIAIVAGRQSSCVSARTVGTVTLDASKSATVVLMGLSQLDSGPDALGIVAFTDAPPAPQNARVRLIHAALGSASEPPAPALSVSAGVTLLAGEVDPGKASTPSTTPAVDALGYTTLASLGETSVSLATVGDAATMHWAAPPMNLDVGQGSVHTGIIVSLDQGALGIAWCSDVNVTGSAPVCTLLRAE
jgi:hypothetical protein